MRIRCVAGLGNPGSRYEWTRHNAGFWVVDRLVQEEKLAWRMLANGWEASGVIEGEKVVLLKPSKYMNRSGEAVLDCLARHGLLPGELLAVVDDAALPVGRLRLRASGSAGGHRGLISIEETIESREYARLRIGVGEPPAEADLADYLLEPLAAAEREAFEPIVERAAQAVRATLREGLPWAMNRTNPAPALDPERSRDEGNGRARGD